MLRSILAAAVASVALLAAPVAIAATTQSGNVTLSYDYSEVDVDGADEAETDTFAIDGRFATPLSGDLGAQFDLGYANVDADQGEDSDVISGTAHLFSRSSTIDGGYLFGALVGVVDNDDTTSWGGGAEGEYYWTNLTGGGQLVYITQDGENGAGDTDIIALSGDLTYFFSENFLGEIGAGYAWTDQDDNGAGSSDEDFWNVNGGVEFQLTNLPASLLANVSFTDFDAAEETAFRVGVRWNFATDSLKARDRLGADLEDLSGFSR